MKLKIQYCALMILAFMLTACGPAKTPNPNLPNLTEILYLAEIRSIELEDDWDGLSNYGPVTAHYVVVPKGTEFVGEATFNVGSKNGGRAMTATEKVSIPVGVVESVLAKLAESELQEGEYKPYLPWTDDYPSLAMRIELQDETITFHTSSQGTAHSPWGVTYRDKSYIIDSGTPMKAFKLFDPHLKQDVLKQLINDVLNSAYDALTPTVIP